MTDAYQNRIATAMPPTSTWCDRVGFVLPLQLGFLACMSDILIGGGVEDFLHWAVPGEHAVPHAVEERPGVSERIGCVAVRRQITPPVESKLFEAAGR